MFENENDFVTEEVTENVEQTTEQTPKTYSQEEFDSAVNSKVNEVLGKKIARKEARIRKEYDREYGEKYRELEDVLRAGMGKEDIGEITNDLREFYTEKKKINIPKRAEYSAQDIETLAKAEAEDIISGGFDEVVEEVDRLTAKGAANMTAREKATFKVLAEYRQRTEKANELAKLGVTADVYESKEFKEFAGMFKSDVPMSKIYENFTKTQPKKELRTMGSMKNNSSNDNGIKDYYSPEEARKFTKKDLDENPALMAAIEKSMTKWGRGR